MISITCLFFHAHTLMQALMASKHLHTHLQTPTHTHTPTHNTYTHTLTYTHRASTLPEMQHVVESEVASMDGVNASHALYRLAKLVNRYSRSMDAVGVPLAEAMPPVWDRCVCACACVYVGGWLWVCVCVSVSVCV